MSAHSVLNLEGCFALAGLVLLLTRSVSAGFADKTAIGRADVIAAITLPLIAVAAFWRATNFYFLSDDFLLIHHAKSALPRLLASITTAGGDGFYRPIGYAMYGLGSVWAGFDPARWHWLSIAMHAANTVLVFLLARTMDLSRWVAWIGAVLFAVHAVHPENVVWMAGGFDLIAAFFVLAGLIAYLRGYSAIALLAMLLGILSKESAYAFPLLVLILAVWSHRRLIEVLPFFVVAVFVVACRLWLFRGVGGYAGGVNPVSLANALFVREWAILFFPINWTFPPGWIFGAMLAIYAGALIWIFTAKIPREGLLMYLGLVLVAALPPVLQLLIGQDLQKARLLYLPSVGFCLLIASSAEHVRAGKWLGAAVILFNIAALSHNMSAWEFASRKARAACETAAQCNSKTVVTGLPGSVHGVYFFANGFAECVALQQHSPSAKDCALTWDPKTMALIQAK